MPNTPAPLALRPKDAAKALGIGERKLWELTKGGVIPHIKIGTATLYPVDELRAWLSEQARKGCRVEG
jgi:excisionase family DNA binding protein